MIGLLVVPLAVRSVAALTSPSPPVTKSLTTAIFYMVQGVLS